MPLNAAQIVVGMRFRLTGVLHVASDGSRGTGRRFTDYPVHIVRIISGRKYPILLGDNYNYSELGWVSADELTGHVTTYITAVVAM